MPELDLKPETIVPELAVGEDEAGGCESRAYAPGYVCVHGLNVAEQRGFILLSLFRRPLVQVLEKNN